MVFSFVNVCSGGQTFTADDAWAPSFCPTNPSNRPQNKKRYCICKNSERAYVLFILVPFLWQYKLNEHGKQKNPAFVSKVRDEGNFNFLVELLLRVGALVPLAQDVAVAVQHAATKHCLLGENAEIATVKVRDVHVCPNPVFYHSSV